MELNPLNVGLSASSHCNLSLFKCLTRCHLQDTKAQEHHNALAIQYKQALEEQLEKMKIKKMEEKELKFEYEVVANGKWDFPVLQCHEDDEPFVPKLEFPLLYSFLDMLTVRKP